MNKSDTLSEIAKALAAAQAEVENATKGNENKHFGSKYADLAECLNTVRPVYAKHGIAIVQSPYYSEDRAGVVTMLVHSSGEWISGNVDTPLQKKDPQGVGSAITYMRRYALAAMCAIAQEDDDAELAVDRTKKVAKELRAATKELGAATQVANQTTAKEVAKEPEGPKGLYTALQAEITQPGRTWAQSEINALQARIRVLYAMDAQLGRAVYDTARQAGVME